MKVVMLSRQELYVVLAGAFQITDIKPNIVELGVLRGENAVHIYNAFGPENLVLIDAWNANSLKGYSPFDELPSWVNSPDAYDYYYGGSVRDQRTYDVIFEEAQDKFKGRLNVKFLRHSSIDALQHLQEETGIAKFDLIYIDANHQYEYVLRDLMRYQDFVAPNGCIMLNDCCHSQQGTLQNLGVLEAVSSFIKRTDFVPVAMTNTDWSDVVLIRKGAPLAGLVDKIINNLEVSYVEVPAQLLPSARIVYGSKRANVSFL